MSRSWTLHALPRLAELCKVPRGESRQAVSRVAGCPRPVFLPRRQDDERAGDDAREVRGRHKQDAAEETPGREAPADPGGFGHPASGEVPCQATQEDQGHGEASGTGPGGDPILKGSHRLIGGRERALARGQRASLLNSSKQDLRSQGPSCQRGPRKDLCSLVGVHRRVAALTELPDARQAPSRMARSASDRAQKFVHENQERAQTRVH